MAIPKSKYSDPKHTPGGEYALNGKEYRGWYVTTFENVAYSGKMLTKESKELQPLSSLKKPSVPFYEKEVVPTNRDKELGVFFRYLIQKKATLKIIEVDKSVYDKFEKLTAYRRTVVKWMIKGPAENTFYNGYPYYGAKHRNKETVSKLESSFPGISTFFKDYGEFVE